MLLIMFLSMSVASRQPRRKPVVFSIAAMLICCFLYSGGTQVSAEPIPVHYHEGFTRAFLALTTLDGRVIASGDLLQEFKDGKVTSEMVFHFKDGSLSDETTVFTQERNFRLVSDHVIQKGPSFPHPIDMYLDVAKSEVTIRAIDKNGDKESTEHIDLPEDLANGLVIILLRNIS